MGREKDWLEQAERDLSKARVDLEHSYFEWACFTAQQAAEKAVKALGMHKGLSIWGHAVSVILRALREKMEIPEELVSLAQVLDAYYIPSRYPNGFDTGKPADYYNLKMASEAIDAADKIIRFCCEHMA
ncbi:HEPN domain-containing protein [Candidatus Solincola sp.]|jgi:HEPN domain-containing protein|nr:HEPN domain-containing protein [Actinomycetota bacterium]MDI7253001.1 HEPN domain-containing protein [Actinomycetota bacterium]